MFVIQVCKRCTVDLQDLLIIQRSIESKTEMNNSFVQEVIADLSVIDVRNAVTNN